MWIFDIYTATFQHNLQMEYRSLSWNDVRLHKDRLHEFSYPLSSLCHEWILICLVCTACRSFHLSLLMNELAPCVTYYRLLALAASWMPLLEHDLIYHLELLCLTPVAVAQNLVYLMWTIACLWFSLSLTFVLLCVGSGNTNVVFRLSLYLLGLKLPLYIVRILYFVVILNLIRLYQSKQAHSTTWQDLLNFKYQILSIFPCCDLQNMNMFSQWNFFLYWTSLCEMWLWEESL